MKCPVCNVEIPHLNKEKVPCGHLLAVKSALDDHIHIHGDIDNKKMMEEFIDITRQECKLDAQKVDVLSRKEFVFHNRQRIGDMIMFTCAIRDFKAAYPDARVNVVSTAMHLWDNNPYLDRTLQATEENTVKIGPGKLTNSSNRIDWHFANAFRVSIEQALNIHIPQGESRGDLWLTDEEYNAPRITKDPYWIIIVGGEKGWGCKMYPFERWQEFVSMNPDTLFYQLGSAGDQHPRLQGPNVVDYIGKTEDRNTGVRDLIKLFLNAEGSIGLVSFHMHMSGALYKPAIVVAGAREPVSFTQYPGHRYLATDGCLPCAATTACWHCAIDTCTDLVDGKEKTPRCVDLITPADLTRALEMYYRGGRLKKGVPCAKPKLKNIVKAPVAIPKVPSVDVAKYGMTFGGGCITEPDWEFMQQVIRDHGVRRVLEFGTGLSTLLMTDLGIDVETYETMPGWVDRIRAINPKSNINLWDGVNLDLGDKRYDMVFVDGPAGGRSREASTRIAAEHAPVVLVHDAGREWEKLWQEKYLHGKFSGPGKGGSRCHLWIRDGGAVKTEPITGVCSVEKRQTEGESGQGTCADDRGTTRPAGGKSVKIVSTARGWGGCARSVTTIMKFLTAAGHRVEFIPFRNKVASREYGEFLRQHPEIRVTETYDTVREACDVLFVYADDYVWEFGKPEVADIFSGLGAERKVMMLNYRRGSVGSIPWTQGWDKYMFLNSSQEQELLKILPGVRTKVLPPCTELEAFLAVQPKYDGMLHIVRHSSQGDTKFASSIADEIDTVLHRAGATIDMLPGPSFVQSRNRFTKHPRTDKPEVIAQFLAMGNIFWYSLPDGYMDMGPRVILEAMAAGLPVVADNWGGAPDRVTSDCGWICGSKDEMVKVLLNVDMTELEYKGMAARARAIDEFVPQRWIDEVLS